MDDLENDFFLNDQDDFCAAVFSEGSEYGSSSRNSSLLETPKNICNNKLKDNFKSSESVKTDFVEVLQEKSFHDHRFSVRFTPKAVKRKFAGPSGLILEEDSDDLLDCDATSVSKKLLADETHYQNISSSQSSVEDLFQSSSWKKLQDEVASNSNFLSVVKHVSIHGVLRETSKKKLPKHIIVPAICVYIKEFNDPVFVCMDDTGEINGKIDKEILQLYSDFIKCGTSLVLKQVTFLCNILLLQKANVLSFYLEDGSVQHLQDWDAVTLKESPDTLNCIHSTTPKLPERHRTEIIIKPSVAKPSLNINNEFLSSKNNHPASNVVSRNFLKNKLQNSVTNSPISSVNQDFESDMMDDFDELLGNIDEKSFLEEF